MSWKSRAKLQQCTSWGSCGSKCWCGWSGQVGQECRGACPTWEPLEPPTPSWPAHRSCVFLGTLPSQNSFEKGQLVLLTQCLALWSPAGVLSCLHELLTFLGF